MKYVISLLLCAPLLLAQDGSPVRISPAPTPTAYTQIIHYTSNIADYTCLALSSQTAPITITVSAVSNANPGVMTATAHGFYFDASNTSTVQKIVAFISGLTGNWTPLNGLHVLTPTSANALSTDVNTTSFGALTGTIAVTTRAPQVTANIWSVQSLVSDGSGNVTILAWPVITTGTTPDKLTGGTNAFVFPCTAPTTRQ